MVTCPGLRVRLAACSGCLQCAWHVCVSCTGAEANSLGTCMPPTHTHPPLTANECVMTRPCAPQARDLFGLNELPLSSVLLKHPDLQEAARWHTYLAGRKRAGEGDGGGGTLPAKLFLGQNGLLVVVHIMLRLLASTSNGGYAC